MRNTLYLLATVATTILCSCTNNFESYYHTASYFPEFTSDSEIKFQCSFLRTAGEDEGLISIKQVDANGEIIEDSGDVQVYTIEKDKILTYSPLKVRYKGKNGTIKTITTTYISFDKSGVFVMGKHDDIAAHSNENSVFLNFHKGEMAAYAKALK